MADTRTTLIWTLRDEVSATARKLESELAKVNLTAKGLGKQMGGAAASMVGFINPTYAAIGAGVALVGFLADATAAAAEEEINVKKLGQALQTSVPHWAGSTTAVEGHIRAMEDLAFSDDAARDSLALLVTSTKNVEKAYHLQAIAANIARLKNVDLNTATVAVIKLSQGSTREMKALGIAVDDTATATDNLGKVEAAVNGQAQAYMDTTVGKIEKMKIKMHDTEESIGAALLPVQSGFLDFVSQGLDGWGMLGDAITHAQGHLTDMDKETAQLALDTETNTEKMKASWADAADAPKPYQKSLEALMVDLRWIIANQSFDDTSASGPGRNPVQRKPGRRSAHQQPRAGGGPVRAGEEYLIGEQGPEVLVMGNRNGFVMANGAGGDTVVHTNLYIDGKVVAQQVDRHLYRRLQRSPATIGSG